jgi:hypothetical protein
MLLVEPVRAGGGALARLRAEVAANEAEWLAPHNFEGRPAEHD